MNLNHHLNKAQLYLNTRRYAAAVKEVEAALAYEPENIQALKYLSLSRYHADDYRGGLQAAQLLLGKAPDDPMSHYLISINYWQLNQINEAEHYIREALAIDATEPDYYGVLSGILLQKKEFEKALSIAEQGLVFEPENLQCLNHRMACLTKLGRKAETIHAVANTLAANPDSPYAHTNVGWSKLETGDYQGAKHHFAEALRLDPSFEYARDGMLEALRAQNPFYRYFLYYIFWMAKKTEKNQVLVIIGLYVGTQFIGRYAEAYPILNPLFYLLVAFAFMTWITEPFFNLLLRFDPIARHALNEDERNASTAVAVGLVGGFGALAIHFFGGLGMDYFIFVALYFGIMMIPATRYFMTKRPAVRRKTGYYALGMGIVGALALLGLPGLFNFFLFGFLGFQILYNVWAMRS
jgi:tetratricopeptide (TPR) repeat protein